MALADDQKGGRPGIENSQEIGYTHVKRLARVSGKYTLSHVDGLRYWPIRELLKRNRQVASIQWFVDHFGFGPL